MAIAIAGLAGHGGEGVAAEVAARWAPEPRVMLAAGLLPVVAPVEAVARDALLLQLHQALHLVALVGLRVRAAAAAGVRGSGELAEVQRGDGGGSGGGIKVQASRG